MDAYKRGIVIGAVLVVAAYFLPWFTTLAQDVTGYGMLVSAVDAIRTMRALGHWEVSILLGYAGVALPAAAALFTMLYCLGKPQGGNGGFGTVLFLAPLAVLAATWLYFLVARFDFMPGSVFLGPLGSMILGDALDLGRTGGLWALHLGALLMALGRYSRPGAA